LLAEELGKSPLVREVGASYLRDYPGGQWRGQVETVLGMESLSRQQSAEAIQHFSEAIPQVEGMVEQRHILRNRARAYRAIGQMELAVQDLRQIVSAQPVQIADVIRLGDAVFDQGEYAEAQQLYDQVLVSDAPVALKAWAKYRLAVSLDHMGKKVEAQKLLAEIRQLETSSPELEHTIRSAATAVLDEMSVKEKSPARMINEQTES
jgi:tetratricopeptide (TPR) repeat protein